MREIKFRGIKKVTKEFVYGNLIYGKNGAYYIMVINNNPISASSSYWSIDSACYNVEHESVGQFTGLKDKNGVDIYEGDIYQVEDGDIYQVFFLNGAFCGGKDISCCVPFGFDCEQVYYEGYSGNMIVSEFHKIMVVVGNIYENKELLNK